MMPEIHERRFLPSTLRRGAFTGLVEFGFLQVLQGLTVEVVECLLEQVQRITQLARAKLPGSLMTDAIRAILEPDDSSGGLSLVG